MATAPDLSKLRIDRAEPARATRRALRLPVMLAVLAALIMAAAVVFLRRNDAVPVQVFTVATGTTAGGQPVGVVANGYVVARTKASVSAKVAGRLAYLGVSEGSRVRAGAVIARLDNADYQAAVSEAEAQLAGARATLIEAESERDHLQRELRRLRAIQTQNPTLLSPQELDVADSRSAQADARARAQAARIQVAVAGLRMARANLENTFIRAPFAGTVLRKEAEVGEVVAPSVGGGLTRGAVVTMADLGTLEVEVDVNEAYIGRVHGGQRARITLDAYPDTSFRGETRQVVPTADRQRATVQVKVSILDDDPRILPEMGAKVDFLEDEPQTAAAAGSPPPPPRITVPAAAVRNAGGQTVVWVVREGRLESRAVTAGPVSAGVREIRSGLSGGEQLLVSGLDAPRPGQRVTVAGRATMSKD
ncbi:MAG: efflux RND transporter periplasmic adaptor subunit [Gemmatimonadaceae bacterium]